MLSPGKGMEHAKMTVPMFTTPIITRTNTTLGSGNIALARDPELVGDVRIRIETFAPDLAGSLILTYPFGHTDISGIGRWEIGFHRDDWTESTLLSLSLEVIGTVTFQVSMIIVDQGEPVDPWVDE